MARQNDDRAKARMKREYDGRMKAMEHKFKVGDLVFNKQTIGNKTMLPWDLNPHTVVGVDHAMITIKRGNEKELARNSSMLKPVIWDDVILPNSGGRGVPAEQWPEEQQRPVADGQEQPGQAGNDEEPVIGQDEEQEDEQEEVAGANAGAAPVEATVEPIVVPAPTVTHGPGRPTKAEQAVRDAQVRQQQAERLRLNPPTRSSTRNKTAADPS